LQAWFGPEPAARRPEQKRDALRAYSAAAYVLFFAPDAEIGDRMPAGVLRMIAVAAVCFSSGAFAVAKERPHQAAVSVHGSTAASRSTGMIGARQRVTGMRRNASRTRAAERDPYADPAAPYKADRLSWSRGQPVVNVPGQTTVLTRQVLDDMNATSLRDAMRSTAGVTVGR
jgi:hypothetical protein